VIENYFYTKMGRKVSKKSSHIARKSNPGLWEKIKNKYIRGSKGGYPGKNSARKMQMAVRDYKKKGGKYIGGSRKSTSLSKWTREDWGYINSRSKTGRYLPKNIRRRLTSREKKRENRLKGSKKGKWIPYSPSVRRKMRKYRRTRGRS